MTAEAIAKALGGRRVGSDWMAKCPCHSDRDPSLSITDAKGGKVLVHCHAGCDQREVIAALRSLGVWEERRPERSVPDDPDPDALKRAEAALAIWQASQSIEGTLVETYLRSRGFVRPASAALRCHAGLKHPSGGVWPAMVALVTHGTTGSPIAVHRTFLAEDGNGKAPVAPAKMMLGPCCGGAVRLGTPTDVLMIGEGIETCIAAMRRLEPRLGQRFPLLAFGRSICRATFAT
jgi:hypothetical protein